MARRGGGMGQEGGLKCAQTWGVAKGWDTLDLKRKQTVGRGRAMGGKKRGKHRGENGAVMGGSPVFQRKWTWGGVWCTRRG